MDPATCYYVGDGGDDEFTGAKSVNIVPVQLLTTGPSQPDFLHHISTLDEPLPPKQAVTEGYLWYSRKL